MIRTDCIGKVFDVKSADFGGKEKVTLCVSVSGGKNKDGSWKPSLFKNFEAWGKQAEFIQSYIRKGDKVWVSGQPYGWKDKEDKVKESIRLLECKTVQKNINRDDVSPTGKPSSPSGQDYKVDKTDSITADDIPF